MDRKPLLVYDGDCGFCRRWIDRWKILTGDKVDYAPFQEAAKRFHHIPKKKFQEAVRKAKETPDTGKPIRDFDLD